MKDFKQYIQELLISYQQIRLAKLGTLRKEYMLSFNKAKQNFDQKLNIHFELNSLEENDLMLAKYYASKNQISLEEANSEVEQFIELLKIDIYNGEKVSFSGIGSFFLSENGEITFESQPDYILFKQLIPHQELSLKPINKDILRIPKEEEKKKSKAWLWATAIVLPLFGLSVYFTAQEDYFDLNNKEAETAAVISKIEKKSSEVKINQTAEEPVFSTIDTFTAPITETKSKSEVKKEITVANPTITKVNPTAEKVTYHVVLGVFKEEKNALNFIQKLDSSIPMVELQPYKNNLHMVFLPLKSNKEQAQLRLASIKKMQPKAWLRKA
jgi:hypothetical protein